MKKHFLLALATLFVAALSGCSGGEKYDAPDPAPSGGTSQFETQQGGADNLSGTSKQADQAASEG